MKIENNLCEYVNKYKIEIPRMGTGFSQSKLKEYPSESELGVRISQNDKDRKKILYDDVIPPNRGDFKPTEKKRTKNVRKEANLNKNKKINEINQKDKHSEHKNSDIKKIEILDKNGIEADYLLKIQPNPDIQNLQEFTGNQQEKTNSVGNGNVENTFTPKKAKIKITLAKNEYMLNNKAIKLKNAGNGSKSMKRIEKLFPVHGDHNQSSKNGDGEVPKLIIFPNDSMVALYNKNERISQTMGSDHEPTFLQDCSNDTLYKNNSNYVNSNHNSNTDSNNLSSISNINKSNIAKN